MMSVNPHYGNLIVLDGVGKSFAAGSYAVDQVNLTVAEGALVALLGPSGCGKTTTLRLIAGLEQPDRGEIWLAGQCVAGKGVWIPPEARRVGMVFQDYALFPHLTVHENIAFALYRMPKAEQHKRVASILDIIELPALGKRYPHQLSGGQQQRVALGRALAAHPTVVLLDEPFSNLDAALRLQMRSQVERIVRSTATTAVLVTHDQEEALSLADQVVVMFEGRIAQIGSPKQIYRTPTSRQVAAFVGEAYWLAAEAHGRVATSQLGDIALLGDAYGAIEALIRPEMLVVIPNSEGNARIRQIVYYGYTQLVEVLLADGSVMHARCGTEIDFAVGQPVMVQVRGATVGFGPG
jgi:iron(III) transport system ATP-binding protein